MAKISRATHKIFGGLGSSGNFAQFGSLVAGAPLVSKDIATIQALAAWDSGFQAASYPANRAILVEDLNGFAFEHSAMVAYILQEGIPEWNAGTTYYIGSIVKKTNTFELYGSVIAANVGNALPSMTDNANWQYLGLTTGAAPAANVVPKFDGTGRLVASLLTDNGVKVSVPGVIESTVTGFKFPDGSVQDTAAAPIVTEQSVVTGARAFDATYYNPAGSTVKIVVVTVGATGSRSTVVALCDAGTSGNPTTNVAADTGGEVGSSAVVTFVVLPGYRYRVLGTGLTLCTWVEWS